MRVSFLIKQYMDGPKESAVIPKLKWVNQSPFPRYGLFNDFGVTEATKVTAEALVEYGADTVKSKTATVLVYDRSRLRPFSSTTVLVYDRNAAAFVSSKDPWVLDLTGNLIAATKDSRNSEVSKNLQAGIAFHEGLRAYVTGYILSPNRPLAQEVVNPEIVDSLKFPGKPSGTRRVTAPIFQFYIHHFSKLPVLKLHSLPYPAIVLWRSILASRSKRSAPGLWTSGSS